MSISVGEPFQFTFILFSKLSGVTFQSIITSDQFHLVVKDLCVHMREKGNRKKLQRKCDDWMKTERGEDRVYAGVGQSEFGVEGKWR